MTWGEGLGHRRRIVVGLSLLAVLAGCTMSRRIAAMYEVQFGLDRVSVARIAGIDVSRAGVDKLTERQRRAVATAAAAGDVPVELELIVSVRNPAANSTTAELFSMDWQLVFDGRDTVSGRSDRRVVIRPGQVVELPIPIRLNLAQYVGRNPDDLLNAMRNAVGESGMPLNVALRAKPSVGSASGPMRYPASLLIARRVGASAY